MKCKCGVKSFQNLVEEWSKKDEADKQFEPFYRAIQAAANSTGTKFKARAIMINRVSFSVRKKPSTIFHIK